MATVAVGDVVRIDATHDPICHEAVKTVVVGDRIGDVHVIGDFVRIDSVRRAVHHLHIIDGDVGLIAAGAVVLDAADETGLVSDIVGAVAVNDKVGNGDIVDICQSRTNDAVDPCIEVIFKLDGRSACAGTCQLDSGKELNWTG